MTSVAQSAPVATATCYERWHRHFFENHKDAARLPWGDACFLNADESQLVRSAVQQFQLGEFARGRGLMRRASLCGALAADPWFLPTLALFIEEEQRHSAILGRFLDRENIPRLKSHWIDGVFRRLRKLAGLEICLTTLVTAEVLAIPFYQALRDATRSPLLRSICVAILSDEAAHLNFQALTIGLVRRPLSMKARTIGAFRHAVLFHGTALLLWQQHRGVFRAARWNFGRFWASSRKIFARLEQQVRRIALDSSSSDPFDERRLD